MSDERTVAGPQERWLLFLVHWVLASVICNLIVAYLIIAGPPTPAWAIGLLVFVNATLGALALIAMAFARRTSSTGRIYRGVGTTFLKHLRP